MRARIASAARVDLVHLFGSLAATQVVTAVVGFAFWTAAARLVPPDQVGLASAAVSAMSLISIFAMLGVGTLLIAELPRSDRREHPLLFGTGMSTVAVAGLVLGLLTALVAPRVGQSLAATGGSVVAVVAFAVGAAATAVGSVFDEAVLGLGRGGVQLLRNAVASVVRLVLLVVFVWLGLRTGVSTAVVWSSSLVLSLVIAFAALRLGRSGSWRSPLRRRLRLVRDQLPAARGHLGLNLILQTSGYLLPVIVAVVAPPSDVAFFNAARLIAAALLSVPFLLTVALFAATASDHSRLAERVRVTLPFGLALTGLFVAVVAVFGHEVMGVYGGEYAARGGSYLLLLTCAGPLLVVKDHFVAVRRVQGRLGEAIRVVLAATVLEVVLTYGGGRLYGVTGVCVGWLVALAVVAVWAGPVVVRAADKRVSARTPSPEPTPHGREGAVL